MWTSEILRFGPTGRRGRAGGGLLPPCALLPCIPFFLSPGHQVGKDQISGAFTVAVTSERSLK